MKRGPCRTIHGIHHPFLSPITTHSFHFLPLLHSFHVLFSFFSLLYILLFLSTQHFTSNPPSLFLPSSSILSPIPIPPSGICLCLNNFQCLLLCPPYSHRTVRLAHPTLSNFLFVLLLILSGDVELNPGPSITSNQLNFSCLNTCSAASISPDLHKPALLREFISDHSIDVLSLTETWLSSDTLPSTLNSLTPPGYSILHLPRPLCNGVKVKGGGLALIYRSYLKLSTLKIPTFSSFESLCVRLTIASSSYILLTIYRPPATNLSLFQSQFTTLLEDLISSPSELIITGDFNFHVNDPTDHRAVSFLSLLDTFGLSQLVSFPTHQAGNTLDLLITRSTSTIISDIDYSCPSISDHSAIHSVLSVPSHSRSPRVTKLTRNIKAIDISSFTSDIFSSCLYSSPSTSLSSYFLQFTSTLSLLIDKHAPLKTISCPSKPRQPFITDAILKQKTIRSKLESIYRRHKSDTNKLNFKHQANLVSKLITSARRTYYRTLISSSSNHPKKLWAALDALLSRKSSPSLPSCASSSLLATSFLNYFADKITRLCSSFDSSSSPLPSPHSPPPFPPPSLSSFPLATVDEVRSAILSSSNATCPLDLIPTTLLKSCLHCLIIPITTLINLSISEGVFPADFKHAIVTPIHKKHSLPTEDLSSYRPISNLNFISKILETIIHSRLNDHLSSFPSLSPFQSAYRKFHSTETALLRIHNDLLLAIDQRKLSALVLLDLSAAFDTVDHNILLARLTSNFGISGSAHSLLSSYLLNRTQSVSIQSLTSSPSSLHTGVPQGSVLGPLLFCLYTTPLTYLFANSSVSYHLYADDTQLYISFSSSDSDIHLSVLSSTLDSVFTWFTSNRLSVNPSKTEFLLVGTPQQRSKLSSISLNFQASSLAPSSSCRNLGVIFDSDLSFNKHISTVCSSSFYHIRQLRQIRSSLDTNSAIILANALVSSKLDYCNSLFVNLPDLSLHRLQLVLELLFPLFVAPTISPLLFVSFIGFPFLNVLHTKLLLSPTKLFIIIIPLTSMTFLFLMILHVIFVLLTNNFSPYPTSLPLVLVDPFSFPLLLSGILFLFIFVLHLPYLLFSLDLRLIFFLLRSFSSLIGFTDFWYWHRVDPSLSW